MAEQSGGMPHLDAHGSARMVDVGSKRFTHRVAVAEAFVRMSAETLQLLLDRNLHKGDALGVARVAGIAATKRTSDLIPLAHPIPLTHVAVDLEPQPEQGGVRIETRVETVGQTGVELEALVAASAAALNIYDMVKAAERGVAIERVQLLMKSGGRSGTYRREERRGETERERKSLLRKRSKARGEVEETTDTHRALSPSQARAATAKKRKKKAAPARSQKKTTQAKAEAKRKAESKRKRAAKAKAAAKEKVQKAKASAKKRAAKAKAKKTAAKASKKTRAKAARKKTPATGAKKAPRKKAASKAATKTARKKAAAKTTSKKTRRRA